MRMLHIFNSCLVCILLNNLATCAIWKNKLKHECTQVIKSKNGSFYNAYLNFYSKTFNDNCKSTMSVAFEMYQNVKIQLNLTILDDVWNYLDLKEKRHLISYIRSRIYTECNTHSLPIKTCNLSSSSTTNNSTSISTRTITILAHDGSWKRIHRTCSICLSQKPLKTPSSSSSMLFSSNTVAKLHLPLSNIIDYETLIAPDNMISVKFIQYQNEPLSSSSSSKSEELRVNQILTRIPISAPLSSIIVYKFRVHIPIVNKPMTRNKSKTSRKCIFYCGWTGECIEDQTKLCDGILNCSNGFDETKIFCEKYLLWKHKTQNLENQPDKSSSSNSHQTNFSGYQFYHKPIIIGGCLLSLFIIIILLVLFLYRSRVNCNHRHHHHHQHGCNKQNDLENQKKKSKKSKSINRPDSNKFSYIDFGISKIKACHTQHKQINDNFYPSDNLISTNSHSRCSNPIHPINKQKPSITSSSTLQYNEPKSFYLSEPIPSICSISTDDNITIMTQLSNNNTTNTSLESPHQYATLPTRNWLKKYRMYIRSTSHNNHPYRHSYRQHRHHRHHLSSPSSNTLPPASLDHLLKSNNNTNNKHHNFFNDHHIETSLNDTTNFQVINKPIFVKSD